MWEKAAGDGRGGRRGGRLSRGDAIAARSSTRRSASGSAKAFSQRDHGQAGVARRATGPSADSDGASATPQRLVLREVADHGNAMRPRRQGPTSPAAARAVKRRPASERPAARDVAHESPRSAPSTTSGPAEQVKAAQGAARSSASDSERRPQRAWRPLWLNPDDAGASSSDS